MICHYVLLHIVYFFVWFNVIIYTYYYLLLYYIKIDDYVKLNYIKLYLLILQIITDRAFRSIAKPGLHAPRGVPFLNLARKYKV